MSKHQSDSSEQKAAESVMLATLESQRGLKFDPNAKLPISVGVQPDAIDPENRVVVEVYARLGQLKGAQLHKVKGDILKLALIGEHIGSEWQRILCFASKEAAKYVTGKSWAAEATRVFGVEIVVVPLSEEHQSIVVQAQGRQRMVNPT